MDPNIFITIACASFVFVAGMLGMSGFISMTVMVVGRQRVICPVVSVRGNER